MILIRLKCFIRLFLTLDASKILDSMQPLAILTIAADTSHERWEFCITCLCNSRGIAVKDHSSFLNSLLVVCINRWITRANSSE